MKSYNACPACNSPHIYLIEDIETCRILDAMQIPKSLFNSSAGDRALGAIPNTISFYRCESCGLEFANPMFVADGDFYAYMQKDMSYYSQRWEFQHSLKHIRPDSNILDVGCGEGIFLELAKEQGHHAIGIDFNQAALETAKSKGLEVYNYDLKQLTQNVATNFDTVVFFHVIEHLDDLEQFFNDLADLLPIGTSLYFSCPSPIRYSQYLEPTLLVGQKEFWDYPPHHQTRWNQKAAEQLLQRMGWKLLKYETEPFDWRNIGTKLANNSLISKGSSLENLPSLYRKMYILLAMLKIIVPSMKYSGLSMLCHARLVR
jgi:2-polyprenyl-3-methyl-5-hydroxy-6-metoxy-1,4-benzoquinol methylase